MGPIITTLCGGAFGLPLLYVAGLFSSIYVHYKLLIENVQRTNSNKSGLYTKLKAECVKVITKILYTFCYNNYYCCEIMDH